MTTSSEPIEIYVRPKGLGGTLHLNIHATKRSKELLVRSLKNGSLHNGERPVAVLEFTLMPEWLEPDEQADKITKPIHVKVPLTAVNVYLED